MRQVIFSIYYRMLFFDMSQICSFILGNEGAGSDILEHEFIDLRVPVVPFVAVIFEILQNVYFKLVLHVLKERRFS